MSVSLGPDGMRGPARRVRASPSDAYEGPPREFALPGGRAVPNPTSTTSTVPVCAAAWITTPAVGKPWENAHPIRAVSSGLQRSDFGSSARNVALQRPSANMTMMLAPQRAAPEQKSA